MRTTILTTFAALAASLSAQGSFTVPKGYDTVEGGSSVLYPFSSPAFRYQESHTSHFGTAIPNIKSVAFRRDGAGATNTTSTARTADLTFLLGQGSHKPFSTTFVSNYSATGPTIVFTRKSVNLPDWTQKPATSPDVWTLVLPFDVKFSYLGIDEFVWEVVVENNTGGTATYTADRTSTSPSSTSTGVVNGTGCTTNAAATTFAMTGSVATSYLEFRLTMGGSRAPFNGSVIAFLGATDPNLAMPALCATLHSSLDVSFPLGTASATGAVTSMVFPFTYTPALVGAKLYNQLACADASQAGLPVALSNGITQSILAPPVGAFNYTYVATATGSTGGGPFTAGSVVTRFEY